MTEQSERPQSPTGMPTVPAAPSRGALKVWQKADFFPALNVWFRDEMVRYGEAQGWEVEIDYLPAAMPLADGVPAALVADDPADLVMHTLDIVPLQKHRLLAPVDHIVEQIQGQWGPASARMVRDLTKEGQWWAVPYFQRSDGGWYQRPAFEEKGIDMAGIRSYPDLVEACLAVSDPEQGLYGWGITINRCGDGDWFRQRVMHGWGAYIQDETGQFVTINSPQMVEAMTWMTSLYLEEHWSGMLPPNILAWNDASNNEAYLGGKLAYTQNGGTVYGQALLDNNPVAEQTGYHPPCGGRVNQEFNSLSGNSFMIPHNARNRERAEDAILHFVLSPETMDAALRNAPAFAIPCYRDLWDKSRYIRTNKVAMEQKSVALDPEAIVPGVWPGPQSSALSRASAEGIQWEMVSSILKGTPVAEAVRTCHERYVAIWKEYGLPGE